MTKEQHDETYWHEKLSPAQYAVLRDKGTEPPFTGKYVNEHENGNYYCAACGHVLFSSNTKFESGSGWPSFTNPVNKENVELHEDTSLGMSRTEVTCSNCGSHLGHVFMDGPIDQGGARYCLNSVSLDFKPKGSDNA